MVDRVLLRTSSKPQKSDLSPRSAALSPPRTSPLVPPLSSMTESADSIPPMNLTTVHMESPVSHYLVQSDRYPPTQRSGQATRNLTSRLGVAASEHSGEDEPAPAPLALEAARKDSALVLKSPERKARKKSSDNSISDALDAGARQGCLRLQQRLQSCGLIYTPRNRRRRL